MKSAALGIVLTVLLTACSGGDAADSAVDVGGPGDALGTPAATGPLLPAATLPPLGAGAAFDTTDLLGKPAVVNFWASWCVFCIAEMPDFEAAHADLGDAVTFIGVDLQDAPDDALELAAETGVTYDLVRDDDGEFFRAVRGLGMPTTLFVTADGVVAFKQTGPVTLEQLLGLIETHLGVTAQSVSATA